MIGYCWTTAVTVAVDSRDPSYSHRRGSFDGECSLAINVLYSRPGVQRSFVPVVSCPCLTRYVDLRYFLGPVLSQELLTSRLRRAQSGVWLTSTFFAHAGLWHFFLSLSVLIPCCTPLISLQSSFYNCHSLPFRVTLRTMLSDGDSRTT